MEEVYHSLADTCHLVNEVIMVAIFSHGICSAVKGSWYNSNSYKRSQLKQNFESRQLQSV